MKMKLSHQNLLQNPQIKSLQKIKDLQNPKPKTQQNLILHHIYNRSSNNTQTNAYIGESNEIPWIR